MTWSGPSIQRALRSPVGLPMAKEPGRTLARSRPTDGFSAMTSVLPTRRSVAARRTRLTHPPCRIRAGTATELRRPAAPGCSVAAGPRGDPDVAVRRPQRRGHDVVGNAEAAALAPARRRREDRADDATAPVHEGPAAVAL